MTCCSAVYLAICCSVLMTCSSSATCELLQCRGSSCCQPVPVPKVVLARVGMSRWLILTVQGLC